MKITIALWKTAPFVRVITPFITGIIVEYLFHFSLGGITIISCLLLLAFYLQTLFPLFLRYKLAPLAGLTLNALILTVGMFITFRNDIRLHPDWFNHKYHEPDYLLVRVETPLIAKTKFYKTNVSVTAIIHKNIQIPAIGNIILYLPIDSNSLSVRYGDLLIIRHPPEPILNSGNPGSMDYKKYAGFKQIFHQAFIHQGEWTLVAHHAGSRFFEWINDARSSLLFQLKKFIPGNKSEWGIAEALLIGYMDDLDKDIVQAYSNTGVVHIIAISGMHLGLIYMTLVGIFSKIPGIKNSFLLQAILILSCLWIFSLLTGASASVLRSAVMFSCMTIGKLVSRNSSIYNSLAASAFILLCYNPYFLWDLGFELSYLAVLGIVLFQSYLLHWVSSSYYLINKIWELVAISLAAQVFTIPVCLYYFHQFPLLFLLTNLIAVPMSTIILFIEIGLLTFSFLPFAAKYIGYLINILIHWMNEFILTINRISFSKIDHIIMSLTDTVLLYLIIAFASGWLLNKKKEWLRISLFLLLSLSILKGYEQWVTLKQQKIIIYQIPHHTAIDLMDGTNATTICDSMVYYDPIIDRNYLKPSAEYFHIKEHIKQLLPDQTGFRYFCFKGVSVLILNKTFAFNSVEQKTKIDLIIITGNPSINLKDLSTAFDCPAYIFDTSNNLWKIAKWMKEAESLHLRCFSIAENGALIYDAIHKTFLP